MCSTNERNNSEVKYSQLNKRTKSIIERRTALAATYRYVAKKLAPHCYKAASVGAAKVLLSGKVTLQPAHRVLKSLLRVLKVSKARSATKRLMRAVLKHALTRKEANNMKRPVCVQKMSGGLVVDSDAADSS